MQNSSELRRKLQVLTTQNFHNVEELKAAGFETRKAGDGLDRVVYAIKDTPWVMKFPKNPQGFGQSRREAHAIEFWRTDKKMRRVMPGLLHYDPKSRNHTHAAV